MLERFRHAWRGVMTPPARLLLEWGVHPNTVTWVGTLCLVLVAFVTIPFGWLWQGALAMGVLVMSDSVDGQMARLGGQESRYGAFLDATLDRVSDAAVMTATIIHFVRIGDSPWVVGLAGWALAMGQITSYVKARAEAEGYRADVGIAARADRLVVVLLGLLLSGFGVPLAAEVAVVLLAVAGTVTVAQRLSTVHAQAEVLQDR